MTVSSAGRADQRLLTESQYLICPNGVNEDLRHWIATWAQGGMEAPDHTKRQEGRYEPQRHSLGHDEQSSPALVSADNAVVRGGFSCRRRRHGRVLRWCRRAAPILGRHAVRQFRGARTDPGCRGRRHSRGGCRLCISPSDCARWCSSYCSEGYSTPERADRAVCPSPKRRRSTSPPGSKFDRRRGATVVRFAASSSSSMRNRQGIHTGTSPCRRSSLMACC